MPCNGVNIRSSMQENLFLGPKVRTAEALTGAGRSAPLLFALWKVSYLNLLQAKFLIFQLVTVAEQADLNLNKTLFVASRPINFLLFYTAIHEHFHPLWKITNHYV